VSDIFEEVEEGIRADKAQSFWNKAWPFIAGAVVAVIGVVGGHSYFESQTAKRIENQGKTFESALSALENEDFAAAQASLSELAATDGGFGLMASHYLADVHMRYAGDEAAAVAALEEAAKDSGPLGQLAQLKAGYYKADTLSLPELEDYLGALLVQDTSLGALAKELIAAKAFETGDVNTARREYRALTLQLSAPEGVRARADLALAIIPSNSTTTNEEESIVEPSVEDQETANTGAEVETEEDPA